MATAQFELEFEDTFAGDTLDSRRWIPNYLPHWSTWDRAAARYAIEDGRLHLRIDKDQPPWCPDIDGDLKVSSIQTGLFAGERDTPNGQHQFNPSATVRNGPHDIRLYTPRYGRFEVRCTASRDPRLMVAFWMIGLGDSPKHSAEICVCEIFGTDAGANHAAVGVGVHPHEDRTIVDDFERVRVPIDVHELHDYSAEWTPERVEFFIDGESVKRVAQSPAYPMQFMLGVYEFPTIPAASHRPHRDQYPKLFTVDSVRGYRYLS